MTACPCPIRNGSLCLGLIKPAYGHVWECRICNTVLSTSKESLKSVGVVFLDDIQSEDCRVHEDSPPSPSALSDLLEDHYQSKNHRKCVQVFLLLPHRGELRSDVCRWLDPFAMFLSRDEQRDEIKELLRQYEHSDSSPASTLVLSKALIILQAYLKTEITAALMTLIGQMSVASLGNPSSELLPSRTEFQGDSINLVVSLVLQFLPEFSEPPFLMPSASTIVERELWDLIAGVAGRGYATQAERVRVVFHLLAGEDPPVQQLVRSGVVPCLVEFLSRDDDPALQCEAAQVLASIARSNYSKVIMEMGAIPVLIRLLSSPNDNVYEGCVVALGSVAYAGPRFRDAVLRAGAMDPLLQQFHRHLQPSTVCAVSCTLCCFCGGTPSPSVDFIRPALPTLAQLLVSSDASVVQVACQSLHYLSGGPSELVQALIDSTVRYRFAGLLLSPDPRVQEMALATVFNIVAGSEVQSQSIVVSNALPSLLVLLSSPEDHIRMDTCRTIAMIAAAGKEQIQVVIDNHVGPPLIQLLTDVQSHIRMEALQAIAIIAGVGSDAQIQFLVRQGCVRPLCGLLTMSNPAIVTTALQCLAEILKGGSKDAVDQIRKADGVKSIKKLQNHKCSDICFEAKSLIDVFFTSSKNRKRSTDSCSSEGLH
jgi:importin subunit alpha-6/7